MWVVARFNSTVERKFRAKGDRKGTELELMIERTFAEAVITELYPRSEIDVFVQVLQADGGEAVAAINAATLALIDAGVAMRDYVVACTCDTDLGALDDSVEFCVLLPTTVSVAVWFLA